MIQRVVLFRFHDAERRHAIAEELARALRDVPIGRPRVGVPVDLAIAGDPASGEPAWHMVLTVTFPDAESVARWRRDPQHEAIAVRLLRPNIAAYISLNTELADVPFHPVDEQ